MPDRDPRRLVFVAGLHRSGTTPLARALARHPDISGLVGTGVKEDEGQHLQQVYQRARAFGGAGRFALQPGAHLTERSPLVTAQNCERLWAAWEPYWDLRCRLLVEKSPPNLVMSRFLQALFPGSALVVVVRHPVVVALSTRKWRKAASRRWLNHASLEAMVEHWLYAHSLLLNDLPLLQRIHILRYEDLVTQPRQTLQGVQRLLDLKTSIPDQGLQPRSGDYEAAWEAMREGGVRQRRSRRRVESRFGAAVETFGYRLDDLQFRANWSVPLR